MKTIIVGLGTQGSKRITMLGNDLVGTIDPLNAQADYKKIEDVPVNLYDAVVVACPDHLKQQVIDYALDNSKHVLCEKPLTLDSLQEYRRLQDFLNKNRLIMYTAYNHRFDSGIMRLKKELDLGTIGSVYFISLYYGNGTAQSIKQSNWRENYLNVISDLGSHLFDLLDFFIPRYKFNFEYVSPSTFENVNYDHAILVSDKQEPKVLIEATYCSWKNTFRCDIIGELGSIHLDGLTKWGESYYTQRTRIFPSGLPKEVIEKFPKGDDTWNKEYEHFKNKVKNFEENNLEKDANMFTLFSRYKNGR